MLVPQLDQRIGRGLHELGLSWQAAMIARAKIEFGLCLILHKV